MKFRWVTINLLLMLMLWGCSQNVAENASKEANPTESALVEATEQNPAETDSQPAPAPTDTPTVTPDPTDIPTATPESTATPTPAPTATVTVAPTEEVVEPVVEEDQAEAASEIDTAELANVIGVQASGSAGSYTFSVEISSPDEGCQKYADWWEVLTEDGQLLYRRVLLHSHAGEQPFVRSGGPVDIAAEQVVWVRAHMNPGGYGGAAFKGSPQSGFEQADLSPDFAADAGSQPPLPDGCAF